MSEQLRAPSRRVGIEFRKSYERRLDDGFIAKYLSGEHVLDIGFQGQDPTTVPITDRAIGIGLDYPGYDGIHLPFPDGSQDAVLASHILEHVPDYRKVLADWYRVIKIGGYLVIFVPHRYLYERRADLPSRWNGDHRRFYTATSLLAEFDESLPVNGFRIRHLVENDTKFSYDAPSHEPPRGCYEIELVVQKIARPGYSDDLTLDPFSHKVRNSLDQIISYAVAENLLKRNATDRIGAFLKSTQYFTPWQKLRREFVFDGASQLTGTTVSEEELKQAIRPLLEFVHVDADAYLARHPELAKARAEGRLKDPVLHWRQLGYFESRTV
jgi:SAM-dependent methyltransferase